MIQIGTKTFDVTHDTSSESAFWEPVARLVAAEYAEGSEAVITLDDGRTAVLSMEDGGIQLAKNNIYLDCSLYETRKLRKIDAETEQHLFYDIVPNNMGPRTIDIGGRYGQTGGTNAAADLVEGAYVARACPSCLYWPKYYNLLRKGYKDYTEDVYDAEEAIAELESMFAPEDAPEQDEDLLESTLYEFFGGAARQVLTEELDIQWMSSKPPFGRRQVQSARKTWTTLDPKKGVKAANKVIEKLLAICDVSFKDGRSKKTVSDFMVADTGDPQKNERAINAKALQWDNIINSMESIVATSAATKKPEEKDAGPQKSPYGDISMKMAEEKENERIRKLFRVPDQYYSKLIEVDCPQFRKRYGEYVEKRKIGVEKELIHGSALSNWNSIIQNSLVLDATKLNPNIVIHGKALGNGTYFALDFAKSNNYVGMAGSLHHHGNATVAVIGVFRTAYGNPMYAIPSEWGTYYDREFPKSGKDCLHADRKVTGWYMDEIVFFDESAYYLEKLLIYSADETALDFLPKMRSGAGEE